MDIAITLSAQAPVFSLSLADTDLATDDGLKTAVLVSLFTDRRADADDELPDPRSGDRRGCWQDQYLANTGDSLGSRLWLLKRAKQTNETIERAKEYMREAMAWMLEDDVVTAIDVAAEWIERGVLGLSVLQ